MDPSRHRSLGLNAACTLPDYAGGGLFNLAVSLARLCGAAPDARYPDLRLPDGRLASEAWQAARTVVLFLVDGMGDDLLRENRHRAPGLWAGRCGAITSVFPSTTATAITTLMTAEPGARHGLLGWYVRDEKSGDIVAPLPMRHRAGGEVCDDALIGRILHTESMLARARRETHFVTLPELAQGPYAQHHGSGACHHTYSSIEELPAAVARAAASGAHAKFIYAYTPLLDTTAHDHGADSYEAMAALSRIESAYAELCACLPDALIVTTADHGFINCPEERYIDFGSHPDLYAMLDGPLSGERRAAYCHVHPQFAESFGTWVEGELGHAVQAMRARDAHAAGLFGPGQGGKAEESAGDWILIAREDWTIGDRLPGEHGRKMIGVHGGLSHEEMWVPLIVREAG